MLYKKSICMLVFAFIFIPTIFTMNRDVEQGSQYDSSMDYTDLLQKAFGDGDSNQSNTSLEIIYNEQMHLNNLLRRYLEEKKSLLLYLDKLALCEATNQPQELFLSKLPEEKQTEIKEAFDNYRQLKKTLIQAIDEENVVDFIMHLSAIQKSTQFQLPLLDDLSDPELETLFTVIEHEAKRLKEFKDYIDSFNNYTWIAQSPNLARTFFVALPVVYLLFVNYVCYHILYKLETKDSISLKTRTAVFALADILAITTILFSSKIIPSKFLCCKKNTAKMPTSTIQEMETLLMEKITCKMSLLAQINALQEKRNAERLELEGKISASNSLKTELELD